MFYVFFPAYSGMLKYVGILIFVGNGAEEGIQNIELKTQNTEKTYPYKHGKDRKKRLV